MSLHPEKGKAIFIRIKEKKLRFRIHIEIIVFPIRLHSRPCAKLTRFLFFLFSLNLAGFFCCMLSSCLTFLPETVNYTWKMDWSGGCSLVSLFLLEVPVTRDLFSSHCHQVTVPQGSSCCWSFLSNTEGSAS